MTSFWQKFLASNEWQFRLLRTIIQGVFGVIVANADLIIGSFVIDPTWKGIIVALVMAVLSPVMAALGKGEVDGDFRSRSIS